MEVKDWFLTRGTFSIKHGDKILDFWEDVWTGNESFKATYPSLFSIVRRENAIMAQVLRNMSLNVAFKRAIMGERLEQWHGPVGRVMNVQLSKGNDTFVWTLCEKKPSESSSRNRTEH